MTVHKALTYLGAYGRSHAATRQELCGIMQLADRQLRATIEDERKNGEIILSSSGSAGYYLPNSAEEIRAYILDTRSRISALEQNIKGAQKLLNRMERQTAQPELF